MCVSSSVDISTANHHCWGFIQAIKRLVLLTAPPPYCGPRLTTHPIRWELGREWRCYHPIIYIYIYRLKQSVAKICNKSVAKNLQQLGLWMCNICIDEQIMQQNCTPHNCKNVPYPATQPLYYRDNINVDERRTQHRQWQLLSCNTGVGMPESNNRCYLIGITRIEH